MRLGGIVVPARSFLVWSCLWFSDFRFSLLVWIGCLRVSLCGLFLVFMFGDFLDLGDVFSLFYGGCLRWVRGVRC